MEEKSMVYGGSSLGLLFIPERRAVELKNCYKALGEARTWEEFRRMVSKAIYEFYLPESIHYHSSGESSVEDLTPFYIPDETPFTPKDIFADDHLPGHPEIEMADWMPEDIQNKFGRRVKYNAMDMNVPSGDVLELDESRMEEIVEALESFGFDCRRDDELIIAATIIDFDPEDYDYSEE